MAYGTSVIFRSTDSGAPILSPTTPGSLKNIFKAILVNGYGSKASLGWTIEFESGNVIVFRMKGGTRMFIRLDDTGSTDVAVSEISAFCSMSSINNGIERTPQVGTNQYLLKRYQSGTNDVPWIAIGDDAGFWFMPRAYYGYTPSSVGALHYWPYYIGDYVCYDLKNKWNFMLACQNTGLSSAWYNAIVITSTNSTNPKYITRGGLLGKGAIAVGLKFPFGGNDVGNISHCIVPYYGTPNLGGVIPSFPIYLGELNLVSASIYYLNGIIPGISAPIAQESPSTTWTYSPNNVPYIESTDSEGNLNIYMVIPGQLNNTTTAQNSGRAIFRVGKGFRNV